MDLLHFSWKEFKPKKLSEKIGLYGFLGTVAGGLIATGCGVALSVAGPIVVPIAIGTAIVWGIAKRKEK